MLDLHLRRLEVLTAWSTWNSHATDTMEKTLVYGSPVRKVRLSFISTLSTCFCDCLAEMDPMKLKSNDSNVWPYVLPFPLDSDKRGLIWSILQSKIGLKILENVDIGKLIYQHDLIEKLPYSNKSVIKYLKKMVKAAILEQGMEGRSEKGRTVWIKWYKPTTLGKWLSLFLKSPSNVSEDLTKTIVEELFCLYSSSIVEVCRKFGMNIESFHRNLDKQYLSELIKRKQASKPQVAVFGSAALDVYGKLEKLPASDEVVFVEETGRFPGGMGANVAVALGKLNVPVSFFGRMGGDSAGRLLLENFCGNLVDVSNVHLVDAPSMETLVLADNQQHRWLFAIGSPQTAISLTLIDEIDWRALHECRIVYVGEVFLEVASRVADFAKSKEKVVIYRPGTPYMSLGRENLQKVLEHTTIFILNQTGWKRLWESNRREMKSPADLHDLGPETVILTQGIKGCQVFTRGEHKEFPVPEQLQRTLRSADPTGAGDAFCAGLIKGLLSKWNLSRSVAYGQIAASIACSRIGSSQAFPAEYEVEAQRQLL